MAKNKVNGLARVILSTALVLAPSFIGCQNTSYSKTTVPTAQKQADPYDFDAFIKALGPQAKYLSEDKTQKIKEMWADSSYDDDRKRLCELYSNPNKFYKEFKEGSSEREYIESFDKQPIETIREQIQSSPWINERNISLPDKIYIFKSIQAPAGR